MNTFEPEIKAVILIFDDDPAGIEFLARIFKTDGRAVRTEEWMPHVSGPQRLLSIVRSP
jgi:DNA primase